MHTEFGSIELCVVLYILENGGLVPFFAGRLQVDIVPEMVVEPIYINLEMPVLIVE